MKLLLAFSLLVTAGYAQKIHPPVPLPIDSATGTVQFQEVVPLEPTLDTKTILQRARSWAAGAYQSSDDAVQRYDPEAGILLVKRQFPVTKTTYYGPRGFHLVTTTLHIYHLLRVEAKPGQYRATMTNFEQSNGTIRLPLQANLGTMNGEELVASLRKQATGASQEKSAVKTARKYTASTLTENRMYVAAIKEKCQAMLDSLKLQLQK